MTDPDPEIDPAAHPDTGGEAPEPVFVVEQGRRLSESVLWRIQRKFFEQQGIQAWSSGTVPHYITGNPWIADSYARVVLGWLRDCAAGTVPASTEEPASAPLDLGQPVHIVELGCGSGRFGYLFLKRLLDLLGRSPLREVPVRYVLTDFTEGNLDFLRKHPCLQDFVAAGRLDFARYDAGEELDGGEIRLDHSGDVLSPETLRNPLVVLANYVFDGIPQDCFAIRAGRLFEGRVMLTCSGGEPDLDDPGLLERLQVSFEERPAAAGYYGDPELDRILAEYAGSLDGTSLLFPCAALRCVRNLGRLSGGRLLLVSGDKGYSREEELARVSGPGLAVHGSFSLMVNYHALGRWFVHRGGTFLHTSQLQGSFQVIAGLLGAPPGGTVETRMAFDDAIERRGPRDFFEVKSGLELCYGNLSLEMLLAWLRLSGGDASVLLGAFPNLLEKVATASEPLLRELHLAIHQVWEAYFPIREHRDLAFHLGVLLSEMRYYPDALFLFQQSVGIYGPNPATLYNIALCLHHLGDHEAAMEEVERSLEASPDFEPALTLREEILAALARLTIPGTPSPGP